MKPEEAAAILGVSLEDITVEGLKQTYKKLALSWDPNKCKDISTKNEFMQISEAQRKFKNVMDNNENYHAEDPLEIAAVLKLFMDMIGISESDANIPGGMSISMMFGNHGMQSDELSTDGDGEYDEEDYDEMDEDDEEEEDEEEDYIPSLQGSSGSNHSNRSNAWEPPAKQYSNMNLKDEVRRERTISEGDRAHSNENAKDGDQEDDGLTTQEREKKMKQAKKRAEKRRKQKEKKQLAAQKILSKDISPEKKGKEYFLGDLNSPESIRLINFGKEKIRSELLNAVNVGQLGKVNQLLSFDYIEYLSLPAAVCQKIASLIRAEISSYYLLHRCATEFERKSGLDLATAQSIAENRLKVATYLILFNNPSLDLNISSTEGLPLLHYCVIFGDLNMLQLLVNSSNLTNKSPFAIEHQQIKRAPLDINKLCRRSGWTALHYSINQLNIGMVKILMDSGANALAPSSNPEDKQLRPIDLIDILLAKFSENPRSFELRAIQEISDIVFGELEVQHALAHHHQKQMLHQQQMLLQQQAKKKAVTTTASPPVHPDSESGVSSKPLTVNNKKNSDNKGKKDSGNVKGPSPDKVTLPIVETKVVKDIQPTKSKESSSVSGENKDATPAVTTSDKSATSEKVNSSSQGQNLDTKSKKKKDKKKVSSSPATSEPAVKNVEVTTEKKDEKDKVNGSGSIGTTGKDVTKEQRNSNSKKKTDSVPQIPADKTRKTESDSKPNNISAFVELSVASRDEMVDRLLAMGFKEVDCLAAISLYGTDIDQAISWLCDRPSVPIATNATAHGKVVVNTSASRAKSAAIANASNEVKGITGSKSTSQSIPAGLPLSGALSISKDAVLQMQNNAKLQKEKEEMRRINRAWNAKAEDEKRKVDEQKKILEAERDKESMQLKHQNLLQQHLAMHVPSNRTNSVNSEQPAVASSASLPNNSFPTPFKIQTPISSSVGPASNATSYPNLVRSSTGLINKDISLGSAPAGSASSYETHASRNLSLLTLLQAGNKSTAGSTSTHEEKPLQMPDAYKSIPQQMPLNQSTASTSSVHTQPALSGISNPSNQSTVGLSISDLIASMNNNPNGFNSNKNLNSQTTHQEGVDSITSRHFQINELQSMQNVIEKTSNGEVATDGTPWTHGSVDYGKISELLSHTSPDNNYQGDERLNKIHGKDSLHSDLNDDNELLSQMLNGAGELSATAKSFVPKSFVAQSQSNSNTTSSSTSKPSPASISSGSYSILSSSESLLQNHGINFGGSLNQSHIFDSMNYGYGGYHLNPSMDANKLGHNESLGFLTSSYPSSLSYTTMDSSIIPTQLQMSHDYLSNIAIPTNYSSNHNNALMGRSPWDLSTDLPLHSLSTYPTTQTLLSMNNSGNVNGMMMGSSQNNNDLSKILPDGSNYLSDFLKQDLDLMENYDEDMSMNPNIDNLLSTLDPSDPK